MKMLLRPRTWTVSALLALTGCLAGGGTDLGKTAQPGATYLCNSHTFEVQSPSGRLLGTVAVTNDDDDLVLDLVGAEGWTISAYRVWAGNLPLRNGRPGLPSDQQRARLGHPTTSDRLRPEPASAQVRIPLDAAELVCGAEPIRVAVRLRLVLRDARGRIRRVAIGWVVPDPAHHPRRGTFFSYSMCCDSGGGGPGGTEPEDPSTGGTAEICATDPYHELCDGDAQ